MQHSEAPHCIDAFDFSPQKFLCANTCGWKSRSVGHSRPSQSALETCLSGACRPSSTPANAWEEPKDISTTCIQTLNRNKLPKVFSKKTQGFFLSPATQFDWQKPILWSELKIHAVGYLLAPVRRSLMGINTNECIKIRHFGFQEFIYLSFWLDLLNLDWLSTDPIEPLYKRYFPKSEKVMWSIWHTYMCDPQRYSLNSLVFTKKCFRLYSLATAFAEHVNARPVQEL